MRPPKRPIRPPRLAGWLLLPVFALLGCGDATAPDSGRIAALALVTAPSETAVKDVVLDVQPVLELRSADGTPLRQAGVEVRATVSTGSLEGTTSVMTDADGRASFTDLAVDGQGSVVLRFACCGVAPAEHPLAVYLGAAGNVLGLSSPQSVEARAGTVLVPGPAVNLTSELWLPVAGAVVHFTLEGPGTIPVTSVVTDAEGLAQLPSFVFHDRPGTTLLHASVESGQRVTFALKATADGEVEVLSDGGFMVGEPGGEFIAPPVLVTYGGVPQAGVSVEFLRSGGSAGPVSVTAVTDASGKTPPVALPLDPQQGVNVYEAWAIGYSAVATVLEIVGAPGAPFHLESGEGPDVSLLEDAQGRTFISIRLVNSVGDPIMDAPISLAEVGEAGTLEWWDMFGPAGSGIQATDELGGVMLTWRVPPEPGTYRIEVATPYAADALVFTAVR